jgi:hypothetical protein
MAEEHGVAHTTVRRALGKLQADGLIRAEPRKGYRVLSLANDPAGGCPIAFIRSEPGAPEQWDEFHARLVRELQTAADRRGWPLMAMGGWPLDSAQVLMRLKSARVCAAMLDSNDADAVRMVKEAGLPTLMLDSWIEGSGIDSVMQDGHHGGMLAARCLAEKGCRKIAWFGPSDFNVHTMDRFGGFAAGLLAAGVAMTPDSLCCSIDADLLPFARKLLGGRKRPEAVAALWTPYRPRTRPGWSSAGICTWSAGVPRNSTARSICRSSRPARLPRPSPGASGPWPMRRWPSWPSAAPIRRCRPCESGFRRV